ncbi:MAG: ribosome maturation factor RimP [Candidatus Omnitrophota bacterium]|nr:MAG: ribosome maturation factor RimP [Candidatus Omnitrophota bacterium]
MDQILLEEIKKKVSSLLTKEAVELVDLIIVRERGKSILRFLLDKSGGITLDECARLNREIGSLLEDTIQESYVLEVASPGLDRPMKITRDFERSMGQLAKIVLHKPFKRQNVWIGVIEGVDEDSVTIRTEDKELLRIERSDIAWARLEV